MSVEVHNGMIFIDQDGMDVDRAMDLATLFTDGGTVDALRREYLGFSMDDEKKLPLLESEALVVADEVELMKHAVKNRERTELEFGFPIANDVHRLQVTALLDKAGFAPIDDHGLRYF